MKDSQFKAIFYTFTHSHASIISVEHERWKLEGILHNFSDTTVYAVEFQQEPMSLYNWPAIFHTGFCEEQRQIQELSYHLRKLKTEKHEHKTSPFEHSIWVLNNMRVNKKC